MENQKTNFIKKRETRIDNNIFSRCLITRNITINISMIGKNLYEILNKNLSNKFEGKCIVEGYIKPGSIKIISYSSGIVKGVNILFEVVFECQSCFPVENMLINCIALNITKAGIRAESSEETPSPIVAFITRDHHYNMPYFSTIKEGDKFVARVIGQRFELNDNYVSIIAELVEPNDYHNFELKKPKINIE
jgi:DNA-directed RNA polymerase subunit E'/Rpb7